MDLPQNLKTFLKQFQLKTMSGNEIFVAIVFFLTQGKNVEINIKEVIKNWSKTLLGKSFNSSFAHRAQGYINSCGRGKICLTNEGIAYIESLLCQTPSVHTTLVIFKNKNTHSFDKFLRNIFKKASKGVEIADTYVSGVIFDNLLDEISNKIPIRFLYDKDTGGFVNRAKRFTKEFSFCIKKSNSFHDRFLIVDGKGYILGPSLKDAADKKPATLVILGKDDSKKLEDLFLNFWNDK